jgi:hypothetical protein
MNKVFCILKNMEHFIFMKTWKVIREYELADANYGTILLMLKNEHFAYVTPELKQNILDFYNELNRTGKNSKVLKI